MKNLLALSIFIFVLLLNSSFTFGQTTYKINSESGAFLREQAAFDSPVILTVPDQATVTIVDKSNAECYQISYLGKTGYVAAFLLEEIAELEATAASSNQDNTLQSSENSNNSSHDSVSNKSHSKDKNKKDNSLGIKFIN